MYNNNHARRLDSRGRIVIPKRIRDIFDIEDGFVEIFTENDLICIRKVADSADEISKARPSARGTSGCNYCICSSCTGFGCPWIPKFSRYQADRLIPNRCYRCVSHDFKMIHDCDFYTNRKRKRFYVKRIRKKETQHSIVMRELRELKGLLVKK